MARPYLLLNCLAVPVYVAEDVAVGRSVFQHFVHEEFEEEGVSDEILEEVPDEIEEEVVTDHIAASAHYVDESFAHAMHHVEASGSHTHVVVRQIGTSIRELANEFAKSRERQRLKKEADKVEVEQITQDGFFALCEEVFRDGINRYNLVALFCFCADVLKKCIKSSMRDIAIRLFKWALKYIVDRVCAWAARHGGWEKAITNTFSNRQLLYVGGVAVAVFAVSGFIIYKLNS